MKTHIDFETASMANLRTAGAWRYAAHPSTHILCMAYAFDDEDPVTWYPGFDLPADFREAVEDPNVIWTAHNAGFEQAIWAKIMAKIHGVKILPPERWDCTAARAAYYGLPRALDGVAKALHLPMQKNPIGEKLIKQYCMPVRGELVRIPHDDLLKMGGYCNDDVRTEQAVDHALPEIPHERKVWIADQRVNQRGVRIDVPFITKALDMTEQVLENDRRALLHRGITKLGAVQQIKDFCSQQGVFLPDMQKATVDHALAFLELPEPVRAVLEHRQNSSRASVKKYRAAINRIDADHRARELFMYSGAHTHRWAGQAIQPQNLYRGTIGKRNARAVELILDGDLIALAEEFNMPQLEILAEALRGMFIAEPGKKLIGGDYSKIEVVGLAAVAGQTDLVEALRDGTDVYKQMAARIYGCSVDRVDATQRQFGKATVLGAGYGMGAERFYNECRLDGIDVSEEEAEAAISTYRESYEAITDFWKFLQRCTIDAVANRGQVIQEPRYPGFYFLHSTAQDFLILTMPSGRRLFYYQPRVRPKMTPWGEMRPTLFFRASKGRAMFENSTYGAKVCENVIQSMCRDLLADAMVRLEQHGFPVVLHAHDEAVAEVPMDAKESEFRKLMERRAPWAAHWPVVCETWTRDRYYKA